MVFWRRACDWTGRPGPSAMCSRLERWSLSGPVHQDTGAGSLSPTPGPTNSCVVLWPMPLM
ncbi:Os02g0813000 [Oryza sativa Japonica Group]|uniref:Os02g0813000 protein n=1 Tax=Oryza sativa subsp. japonica TaxID=39947 RepID=C7IY29_ORYSJ|nr:Os02g0813000 [Oryza sativa Japonica Group]|eukprot:NP_001173203.1 Os02g0813000 [Oryza sativa Japonica Group]